MSVKAGDIAAAVERLAPTYLAEKWDNVGIMAGSKSKDVSKILFALDCRDGVVDEAIEIGADMIVTHHPLIFSGIKRLDFSIPLCARLAKLIKNDITVYSAHTNLDIADGGTNSTLADMLGLKNIEGLVNTENEGFYMGRTGELAEEMTAEQFTEFVKGVLGAERLAVSGCKNKMIKKVGICTGAGSEFIAAAVQKGCDAYITGDMKYHEGQTAEDLGLFVIDGTHYLTEVIAMPKLKEYVEKNVSGAECIVSAVNTQTINII